MNDLELEILGRLVCALRPDWDSFGVRANLRKLDKPLAEATPRALAAAMDPDVRTPAAILWEEIPNVIPRSEAVRPGRGDPCAHCGRTQWGCERAQRNTGLDPHAYAPRDPR